MQATSPIRDSTDLDNAVRLFRHSEYDSLMSVNEIEDFHTWRIGIDGTPESVNYDYRNRQRRQNIEKKYLENGSFYIFTPDSLKKNVNRLSGNIGMYAMEKFKMFQIDEPQDIPLCEAIMKYYQLESKLFPK
jgi:N-acylneuraminate cytidylyltransferase